MSAEIEDQEARRRELEARWLRSRRPGNPYARPIPGDTVYCGSFVMTVTRANGDYRDVTIGIRETALSDVYVIAFGSLPYRQLLALQDEESADYRNFIAGSTHHVMASVAGRLKLEASKMGEFNDPYLRDTSAYLRREGDLLSAGCQSLRTYLERWG